MIRSQLRAAGENAHAKFLIDFLNVVYRQSRLKVENTVGGAVKALFLLHERNLRTL